MATAAAETDALPEAVASPWVVVAPLAALAWSWAAWVLPAATDAAGGISFEMMMGLVCFGPLAMFWGVFSCVRHIWQGSLLIRAAWLSVPVLGVGITLAAVTGLGLTARVWLNESELRAAAAEVTGEEERYSPERRAGSFTVYRAWNRGEAVYLFTGHDFVSPVGIALVPPGSPPPPRGVYLDRLYGDWYRVVDHRD